MSLAFPKTGPRRKRAPKVWRSASHLRHVRSLACRGCGRGGPNEAHHVGAHPMGRKPSDALACPLCRGCHDSWHSTARIAGLETRDGSMMLQWCGVIHALGGSRIADNLDPETVARRMAAERESK